MKEKTLTHLFFATSLLYVSCLSFITFPLNTLLKPLPIIVLLWWARVHMPTNIKWVFLFWALVLSVGGDMTLTFNGQESFLAGLSLFFLAHLFYIGFFFGTPRLTPSTVLPVLGLLTLSGYLAHLFSPYLGDLYIPVMAYMIVLLLMVSMALLGERNTALSKWGALFFLSSDALLATQLFIKPSVPLSHAIIVTYYLAQFFIFKGGLTTVKARAVTT